MNKKIIKNDIRGTHLLPSQVDLNLGHSLSPLILRKNSIGFQRLYSFYSKEKNYIVDTVPLKKLRAIEVPKRQGFFSKI